MILPTCSAFSFAERTSSVSSPSCLLALVNCLPAFPICLVKPSIPLPVPGTFTPCTFFGFLAILLPSSTPPTRPATVPTPATTVATPDEPELPFEDPEVPPLLDRELELELEPFRLRARAFELLALELLARAPELFARAFAPLDLLRAFVVLPFEAFALLLEDFALPFEALAPFLAFEPPEDDEREDPAEDFR